MGLTADQDGFARVDSLVEWCRESDLYLILDMHDAPGGQTGDNIDAATAIPGCSTAKSASNFTVTSGAG